METKCYCGHTIRCDCGSKQETLQDIAQWVIEFRITKNEYAKVSDFEMYHTIIEKVSKWQQERSYSEEEVLHLLDTLWDRLDIWYNEKVDREFNLIDWFNQCELKKQ